MKNVMKCLGIFLLTGFNFAMAQDAVYGFVNDESLSPLAGVELVLEDEYGNTYTTTTDAQGFYEFIGIQGWFLIHPLNQSLDIISQPCAFQEGYLDGSEDKVIIFEANAVTGVAVDFGTIPPGYTAPKAVISGDVFDLRMNLWNFSYLGTVPDTLEVTGTWYVPGEGLLEAQVIESNLSGVYAGTLAGTSGQNNGNALSLNISRQEWPYLNLDGEAAHFSFRISAAGLARLNNAQGKASFCSYYRLYRDGNLIGEGSSNWFGNILED